MIKCSVLIAFVLIGVMSLGQSLEKITCFDETVYEINDTIVLGPPSKTDNRYRYVYYNNGPEGKYINLEKDLCYSRIRVIKLENTDNQESRYIVTARNKGFLSYKFKIDIENAIRIGEVTLPISRSGKVLYAYKLTDTALFTCACKLDSSCKNRNAEFFARFSGKDYSTAKQNEFKRHDLISNYSLKFDKLVSNYSLDTMFQVGVIFTTGEYDFSDSSFHLKPLKNAFLIDVANDAINDTSYNPIVLDLTQLDSLSMNLLPKEAEMFIKRKETFSGYIDRNVYGIVCFKLRSVSKKESKTLVVGKILALYLFETEKRKGTLLDYQEFK